MTRPVTVKSPGELLAFLFSTWPETKKTKIRSLLKHQSVTVNGEPVTQFNHPLQPGDVVGVRPVRYAAPKTSISAGIKVWFEDEHLMVIDKPSGLLSIAPCSTTVPFPINTALLINGLPIVFPNIAGFSRN